MEDLVVKTMTIDEFMNFCEKVKLLDNDRKPFWGNTGSDWQEGKQSIFRYGGTKKPKGGENNNK